MLKPGPCTKGWIFFFFEGGSLDIKNLKRNCKRALNPFLQKEVLRYACLYFLSTEGRSRHRKQKKEAKVFGVCDAIKRHKSADSLPPMIALKNLPSLPGLSRPTYLPRGRALLVDIMNPILHAISQPSRLVWLYYQGWVIAVLHRRLDIPIFLATTHRLHVQVSRFQF